MAQIALAYGPPGERGVTTLMSVGDGELPLNQYLGDVKTYSALLSATVGLYAVATGKKRLAGIASAAAMLLALAR